MTNSIDPVFLPPGYSYGFAGGPAFDTRYTVADGGGESRVQILEEPKWRWTAQRENYDGIVNTSTLTDFFLARRGGFYGFYFIDSIDFTTNSDGKTAPTMLDQLIGIGDGTTTRFQLRKQYDDPGGMTARAFPRRLVPLQGTATAAQARLFGINSGDSIEPQVAVAGVQVASGLVFKPASFEVILPSAPALGEAVTWGGYHATQARFSNSTDEGLDAVVSGFESGEVAFQIESIQFDDPVPLMPGGSPYGYEELASQTDDINLSAREAFAYEVDTAGALNGFLDDLDSYPTGGPHHFIANTGSFTLTVLDYLGNSVGTISAGSRAWVFVKEDGSGNRTPVLWG